MRGVRKSGLAVGSWLCVAVLVGPVALRAADRSGDPLAVHAGVRNYAGVPEGILSAAEAHVARTFKEIGITVLFSNLPLETDQNAEPSQIRLHILPQSFLTNRPDTMGLAQEHGNIAYIFYDRIQDFVREFESEPRMKDSLALMLGCIISHETGHLLLPGLGHQPSTLMRATWRSSDLHDIEVRGARFTSAQAAIMRQTLRGLIASGVRE